MLEALRKYFHGKASAQKTRIYFIQERCSNPVPVQRDMLREQGIQKGTQVTPLPQPLTETTGRRKEGRSPLQGASVRSATHRSVGMECEEGREKAFLMESSGKHGMQKR